MKCCSFQKKDLEKHYDRMSHRFYCLNGVDDVNLKQVFLNSFPESLGNEAYRALEARNVTIAQTTLGELYQLILNALAKLCNQKKFLAEFERTGKRLGTACDDKYLQIKCKDKSSCDYVNPTKASHPGMNPDHYQLAKEECEQLVSQGIIEPTTSPWACEAFYVNKRSEQVCGKLRLSAKVLLSFDLKFVFGIRITFKVLFSSPDEQSHAELLSKFYSLVAKYRIMLSEKKMEVGNPPQWTPRQTEAVKAIKCLAEKMPPLKIPASAEKRILQTDASDECWGAVLLVQDNNKRHVYGYKIQKKDAPSCTTFEVVKLVLTVEVHIKYIKGTENVLADFLSRPKAYKSEENYLKDASQVQKHTPHLLSMVFSVASYKEEGSSSTPTPPIPVFDLPEEIVETIGDLTFEKRAKLCYKTFLTILLKNHGLCIKALGFTQTTHSSTSSTSMTYGGFQKKHCASSTTSLKASRLA
ncbi:putative reverse transcriptase domain, viral movement protein [Tanacetum coccineum]